MRILFVLEHSGVGPLVPALRQLHDRGHTIVLAARRVKTGRTHELLQELADGSERIIYRQLPSAGGGPWASVAKPLRFGIDYLRYLEPRYRDATKLRARARGRAPDWVVRAGRVAGRAGVPGVVALRRGLQLVERCLPPPNGAVRFLQQETPDVLLVTPLVDLGSRQADWLRAAKRLGIRTGYPVFSWDNLTNKGLLRDVPDLVLVWNDLQAREAQELHGVPGGRIRLTGAPVCDPWFEREPSRSREELCREVGLRADRPIVLYLCSSEFVAPHEVGFVLGWVRRLRARGGVFADAGILIRPYPDTAQHWTDAGVDEPQVAVWPRFGEGPHDEASRANYYDSIHHAAAVVGINTTAQIEAAIVGRPVHTLLADEYRATQEGTLHFHYLEDGDFGLLHVGRTFDEHARLLEESLGGEPDDGRNERFLRRFVRPLGLERPATAEVVAAVEALGARPRPAPDRGPAVGVLVRPVLAALVRPRRASERSRDGKREASPARELRRTVERIRGGRSDAAVLAEPWLGDEIGELLYWIPFLRWLQTGTVGLRDRLHVACRASTSVWYEGIGAHRVELEDAAEAAARFGLDPGSFETLSPAAVDRARAELARQDPARRIQHRLVEYAPPQAPPAPAGLPKGFVATLLGSGPDGLAAAVAERAPVVGLDGLDRAAQTAVLARARGFVGSYGVETYLALLVGLPAVALDAGDADPDDLLVVGSFLARPPFGTLHTIEPSATAAETAARALALVDEPASALARV